ncbi:MAG TPA: carboxylating nicotinate-nucleotide diphosphorylase [Propionibacteriaceae bacterium]|nr:carboxylating nicotinate-nucleotide diphosphorylase [Propionibacteriaceae bacterium]
MIYTTLTDVAGLVTAAGLDLNAVSLIISEALEEDLGGRGVLPLGAGVGLDVTSCATIPAAQTAHGEFVVRESGTVAGLPVAAYAVATVCAPADEFELTLQATDGDRVARGDVLMSITGNARALLTVERVALNLITMMSGVATATRAWVDALAGTNTKVRDSRKTLPGLRMLQKYAVRVAGGINHRMSLADAALIKDNHVIAAGGVVEAYRAVRKSFPNVPVEVEVTSAEQARLVVAAGATEILLDNMGSDAMAGIVAELAGLATFEASGGLTLLNAAEVAQTGVNFVAVGAITHSAPALDIALDFSSGN